MIHIYIYIYIYIYVCENHNSKIHVLSLMLQRFETEGKIIILTYYLALKIILSYLIKQI